MQNKTSIIKYLQKTKSNQIRLSNYTFDNESSGQRGFALKVRSS